MELDFQRMGEAFRRIESADTFPKGEVNAYLWNELVLPLLQGGTLRFGDIDFSRFQADDLHLVEERCAAMERASGKLADLTERLVCLPCAAIQGRAYC